MFNIGLSCAFFLIKSAPSRLTPNEALPQTPQGTLSLDPASPLTPGLSLRFTSRSARCWISHSGQLCQFLIPHSSFFISTSFLHNTNTPITFGTAISPLKISDTPHTSSMLHIVPMHPQAIAIILYIISLRGKRYLQALSPMKNHPATVANAKSISEPDMKYFPAPPRAAL